MFRDTRQRPMKQFLTGVHNQYHWMTVIFLLNKYASTNSKTTSHISSSVTSSKGGYYQLLPQSRCICISVRWWETLFWNIPIAQPMWGVITHLSNPKRRTTWTNTLKNIPTPTCLPLPVTISLSNHPTFLHLPEVSNHHGPVIIQFCHEYAKILKR